MEKETKRSIEWLVEEIMRGSTGEDRNMEEKELIKRGEFRKRTERLVRNLMLRELEKAREEGYQDCMDDIWEKAKDIRSWTEYDGSISANDVEAGIREAYLEIESKLKDSK